MTRTFLLLTVATALAACRESETPKAAPGAVERTTQDLERNAAAEVNEAIRKADREADARADAAKRRIAASERSRLRDP